MTNTLTEDCRIIMNTFSEASHEVVQLQKRVLKDELTFKKDHKQNLRKNE